MFSSLLKKFVKKVTNYIDLLLIIPLLISFPAFYIFARIGGKRLKYSRKLLKNLGIYPIRDHYYNPLFKDINLKKSLREPRYLPGINFSERKQLNFLENLIFNHELNGLNDKDSDDLSFTLQMVVLNQEMQNFFIRLLGFLNLKQLLK